MMIDNQQRDQRMHRAWSWALSRIRVTANPPHRRAKQVAVVAALLVELQALDTIPLLHKVYAGDGRWAVTAARRLYPRAWATLEIGFCLAAAFGYRYVELATGAPLDPLAPPVWLVEYAVE